MEFNRVSYISAKKYFEYMVYKMHEYRTHTCNALRSHDIGKKVKLSGWVHRKRDHGNLLFIDLRDHYGITQIVVTNEDSFLISASVTPNCSATIFLTRCSILSICSLQGRC